MKIHPNSSILIYAKVPKVLCIIYLLSSIIFYFYHPNDFEIYEVAKLKIMDKNEELLQFFGQSDSISFFKSLTWYLFFYILLDSGCKIFSLIKIIGRMQGRPTNMKINRLQKISTLLILLLGGKFIIFMVSSFLENCNF